MPLLQSVVRLINVMWRGYSDHDQRRTLAGVRIRVKGSEQDIAPIARGDAIVFTVGSRAPVVKAHDEFSLLHVYLVVKLLDIASARIKLLTQVTNLQTRGVNGNRSNM